MSILWGVRLYGRVDRVPGLCYVSTRFVHVWFIPLIPLETYLVLAAPGERGNRGLSISLSLKSLFVGWLRACLPAIVISGAITSMAVIDIFTTGNGSQALRAAGPCFAVSTGLFGLGFVFSKASPPRAVELGAHLGIPEDVVLGLLTPGDEPLKELEAFLSANPDALAMSNCISERVG
jgi:hypothetical protein